MRSHPYVLIYLATNWSRQACCSDFLVDLGQTTQRMPTKLLGSHLSPRGANAVFEQTFTFLLSEILG